MSILEDFLIASSENLERARGIHAAHPDLASQSLHAAAALGDDVRVREHLALNAPIGPAGPHNWDALTCLCFSRFLGADRNGARPSPFTRAATALLDAGASAQTGYFDANHGPAPEFESVLYGAAGRAFHDELTRLLLDRGADPNDGEVSYHSPETYDLRALKVLVESGKLTPESLSTMLLRKCDWHDRDGVAYLLANGADPNRNTHWGKTSLHQAVLRDNAIETVELLLARGGDPSLPDQHGVSAIALAARRGRGGLLGLFANSGVDCTLTGLDKLLAACARDQGDAARTIAKNEPALVSGLRDNGGKILAEFAGNGNTAGVTLLLDLGVHVDARLTDGDGYWTLAPDSTALHNAAWRAQHDTVKQLLARGADVNARDRKGQTPLTLAVRACVDSYWTERRAPDSVRALLEAGASIPAAGELAKGYTEVDVLLASWSAR